MSPLVVPSCCLSCGQGREVGQGCRGGGGCMHVAGSRRRAVGCGGVVAAESPEVQGSGPTHPIVKKGSKTKWIRLVRPSMHPPRIELGSGPWQGPILPLDHGCINCNQLVLVSHSAIVPAIKLVCESDGSSGACCMPECSWGAAGRRHYRSGMQRHAPDAADVP